MLSRHRMGELIRLALGVSSVGVFEEDKVNQVADELMEAVEKFAWARGLLENNTKEKPELPGQKIAMVTYAAGIRQVIGEAEIIEDEVVIRIPMASLELGVSRALRAEAAKGFNLSKKEINLKPPQMVTGILFPTDLKFQIDRSEH